MRSHVNHSAVLLSTALALTAPGCSPARDRSPDASVSLESSPTDPARNLRSSLNPTDVTLERHPVAGRAGGRDRDRPPPLEVRAFDGLVHRGGAVSSSDPSHPESINVLRSLAGALRSLPTRPDATLRAAERIDYEADKIEHDGDPSRFGAATVREALKQATGALTSVQRDTPELRGLHGKIVEARDAVDQIDPELPLSRQSGRLRVAMERLSEALVIVGQDW